MIASSRCASSAATSVVRSAPVSAAAVGRSASAPTAAAAARKLAKANNNNNNKVGARSLVAASASAISTPTPSAPQTIVFVSAEVAPFSKTGGLGDVLLGLPKELAARGHRVITIAPR